jgi:hypothetical protein
MKKTALICALLAAAAAAANATTIVLFDTGLTAGGTLLPQNNGADGNYAVSFDGTSYVANTYTAGAYYQPTPADDAEWITAAVDNSGSTNLWTVGGPYTYTETFTVVTAGTVDITGNWAVDNCGTIELNGAPATGSGTTIGGGATPSCVNAPATYQSLTPFSISANLAAGSGYTLTFEVWNAGSSPNPTALLVTDLQGQSGVTPEPSSIVLTLAGLGLLGIGIPRRWARKPRA